MSQLLMFTPIDSFHFSNTKLVFQFFNTFTVFLKCLFWMDWQNLFRIIIVRFTHLSLISYLIGIKFNCIIWFKLLSYDLDILSIIWEITSYNMKFIFQVSLLSSSMQNTKLLHYFYQSIETSIQRWWNVLLF